MQSFHNIDLKNYHTFSVSQLCRRLVEVNSVGELVQLCQSEALPSKPYLMLGKGSNVLFTEPFEGLVIANKILGIDVSEQADLWQLHVGAGEDWPSLVRWSVEQGYSGLENLAMIPGCAGSAPIQNIGAYGLELREVCDYVDVLCLDTLQVKRMSNQECQFGYRDSVFKHELQQKVIVVAIGLKLTKHWQPKLNYGPLQNLESESISAQEVFDCVCETRRSKLPDPNGIGNAGSFFKNPVISTEVLLELKARFPKLVSYSTDGGAKVAAGWLIDQCGLKGTILGGAQVHPKQALVIVNRDNASAQDIIQLASLVRQRVLETFSIELEHEVRFIARTGETSLTQILDAKQ